MSDVTRILSQIEQGDPQAAEQLLPLVYDELRKLAAAKLAQEKPGQTLQATALVHEAYLRLVGGGEDRGQKSEVRDQKSDETPAAPTSDLRPLTSSADLQPLTFGPSFHSRGHFFAAAAEAMRRILVENARRKHSQKRGGEHQRLDWEAFDIAAPERAEEVVAIDEALDELERIDAAAAQLVKLRYFSGLSIPQAAEILDISARTADRLWVYARAWLFRKIGRELSGDQPAEAE
jgi:RNA polymerase sigma factor (sigma-70 family)